MDMYRFPQPYHQKSSDDSGSELMVVSAAHTPALIRNAGEQAQRRFLEFFTAHIRNPGVDGGEKVWRLAGEKCSALVERISRWSVAGSSRRG